MSSSLRDQMIVTFSVSASIASPCLARAGREKVTTVTLITASATYKVIQSFPIFFQNIYI